MDSNTEKPEEQSRELSLEQKEKAFKLDLQNQSSEVRDLYSQLYSNEWLKLLKENKNRPVAISIEDREKILRQAVARVQFPNVDPVKMERDFTNRGFPTKGSQPSSDFDPET